MAKILVQFGKCGPVAHIARVGPVSLIDFYVPKEGEPYESLQASRTRIVTMDDEDVEMIRLFALDRKKISGKQIEEFQNELNRKYPALSIPEQGEV